MRLACFGKILELSEGWRVVILEEERRTVRESAVLLTAPSWLELLQSLYGSFCVRPCLSLQTLFLSLRMACICWHVDIKVGICHLDMFVTSSWFLFFWLDTESRLFLLLVLEDGFRHSPSFLERSQIVLNRQYLVFMRILGWHVIF
jgi:hypothetical protein